VNYERNKKGARFFETQCITKDQIIHYCGNTAEDWITTV